MVVTVVLQLMLSFAAFLSEQFCWRVEALLVLPFQEWPEDWKTEANEFRKAKGQVRMREALDIEKCFEGTIHENVGFWDVYFKKKPIWTTNDILQVLGPFATINTSSGWKMEFGYDRWITVDGGELHEPSQVVFHFKHGVLIGMAHGRVGFDGY